MLEIDIRPQEGLEAKLWKTVSKTIESTFDFSGAGSAVVEVRPLSGKIYSVHIIPDEGSVIGQIHILPDSKPILNCSDQRYTSVTVGNLVIRVYYKHTDKSQLFSQKK